MEREGSVIAGNRIGGLKAAAKNKERRGADWYRRIGAAGGKSKKTKPSGFATMSPERHKEISAKGGTIGQIGKNKEFDYEAYRERVRQYAEKHKEDN